MTARSLLFCFISCFLFYEGKAQTLDATLKTYADQYEQEKIHIHFDKDGYLPGETIWMKAYVLSGSKPSALSKTIYFDWTDINGNLLLHSASPIMEGVSTSSFTLPPGFAIVGNSVHIKAYTQWMLNFDSSFLFNKNVAVLTSWDGSVRPDKHAVSVQFFPEGGYLINGIGSVLGFEVTDQRGRPVDAKGVIKKNIDEVVDSFATAHEGMGTFKFVPHSNETYTAYWTDEFGDTHTTALPQVKASGAAIRINNTARDNSIHFHLERTLDAGDDYKSLTIMATSHQQVIYKTTVDLGTQMNLDGNIPTRSIPDGVVQITVFDSKMVPFAERIAFVNNYQHRFATQVKKDVVNLNKRGRNEITIEVPDSISASLSVSITDGGLGYDTAGNIITDLLLSSDIKGNVVNPAYYFTGNPDTANAHLDLLMRTHGWRRFNWQDAVAGRFPSIQFPADNEYLSIKGKIGSTSAFDASDSIALLVMTRDRKRHILNLPLNQNGTFTQHGVFFYDSLQVLYLMNHANKINAGTIINVQSSLLPPSTLSSVRASEPLFQWNKVPDVVLEKESNGLITEDHNYARASTGMNYVFAPVAVRSDQTKIGSETASHYLQSNFPDLKFPYGTKDADANNSQDNRYVSYVVNTGSPSSAAAAPKNNVNVQLDGVNVTMDDLRQVSMKEVLFIKFLSKTNPKDLPTLAITSRLSIYQDNIMNNKTGYAVVSGYTPAREFYSPTYTDNPIDVAATDFRSTIYWNPRVVVDKNNRKIKLVFYNNDISNKFRVVVEGMNKEGKLTRIEEIIK